MSDSSLPILQQRLARLPIGVLAERFSLQTQIIALAHGEHNRDLRDAMLLAAKESAFMLLKTRNVRPHFALLAWGIAGATGNETLLWNLCRLHPSHLSHGTKQHHADIAHLAKYSTMLGLVHALYRAIALDEPSEEHEDALLRLLAADRSNKVAFQWISGLLALAIAVRDNRELDLPVRLHAAALHATKLRRPLEPTVNLDLAALGALAIAKQHHTERSVYPEVLPDLPLINRPAIDAA